MLPSLGSKKKVSKPSPKMMLMSASSVAISRTMARRDISQDCPPSSGKSKKKSSREKIQIVIQASIADPKLDIFSWVITHILPIIQARVRGFLTRKHLAIKIDRLLKIQHRLLRTQRVWTKPPGVHEEVTITIAQIQDPTQDCTKITS